ncbi:hypothetical protein V6N11_047970 [Hibiscus sabdariffa]|uniref:Uncharacterized protein n=1 Tax=Hibiscus sabdariffa TaxID=183260 RepID=A0ABR2NXL2_9ROSI
MNGARWMVQWGWKGLSVMGDGRFRGDDEWVLDGRLVDGGGKGWRMKARGFDFRQRRGVRGLGLDGWCPKG